MSRLVSAFRQLRGGWAIFARQPATESWDSLIFVFLLAALLWLITHPYQGIYHDAIIYSLLAARKLTPEGFANDLFFIFGSQDDFSAYTPVFSTLVSVVGLDLASRLVVLAGGMMWVFSFMWLGRAIFQDGLPWKFVVFLAAVIVWSYSPNGQTFQLGENFATPRMLSIPLGLMAIAAELGCRRFLGFALAVVATLLHPLLGIWALALILCYRWSFGLMAVMAVMIFVAVFVISFAYPIGGLRVMGDAWVDMVRVSSPDVFLGGWGKLCIDRPLLCLMAFLIGIKHGQLRLRPLYLALCLMVASAYLLSLICSHLQPVELVMQTQPWRVMWLAMCMAVFAVVDGVWRLMSHGRLHVLLCCLGVLLIYAFDGHQLWMAMAITVLLLNDRAMSWMLMCLQWLEARKRLLWFFVFSFAAMLLPRYLIDLEINSVAPTPDWRWLPLHLNGFLLAGGLGLGTLFWAVLVSVRSARYFAWLVVVPLLFVEMSHWDHRSSLQKDFEASYLPVVDKSIPFAASIRRGDVVAWPGGEMLVWFVLRTAVYASPIQAIGSVFSELKADESWRRLRRVASVYAVEKDQEISEAKPPEIFRGRLVAEGRDAQDIHGNYTTDVQPLGVPYLCADPVLDWVVIQPAPNLAQNAGLRPTDTYLDFRGQMWELYACRHLRRKS